MSIAFRSVLIIADIEGSSGCWSYRASSFLTPEWSRACVGMSLDVNAVVRALFVAGVEHILVKDFHRTGYNILPELLDPKARLVSGYKCGPVPGIGNPGKAQAVMFVGMHAASGTEGFLAHTLTSRLARLEVDGRPLAEVELFSASLAPYGLRPIFFSGCPIACAQAKDVIRGIQTYAIDKSWRPEMSEINVWRSRLAEAAVASLGNTSAEPYTLEGPFKAAVSLRDGQKKARKIARRWDFDQAGAQIFITAPNMNDLYLQLVRLCYLTPLIEKLLPFGLGCYNLKGRFGLHWVRRRTRRR